ncbi:hypothetical protein F5Y15DRAFT_289116 [Xylariaceae sp. FL0016]|nr:hypothetical protein F5Y15DRAFT_289116 [Xylariaceae sp. FL0016]
MADRTPYFFLAPTWDFPPPQAGPIQLGNVITSVKTPERPLFRAPQPDGLDVFSSTKTQVVFSTEDLRAGRFEIFTRFMSVVLGLGVDAGVGWENSNTSQYSFESLETVQFLPEQGYIRGCVSAASVRHYLEKSHYRKPIYIITGIKIARGAAARTTQKRGVDGSASVELDATAWTGVPVGAGPGIGTSKSKSQSTAWEGSSDFVFAFRVRKILVDRKTGAVKKEEDYKRGAMLRLGESIKQEIEIVEKEVDDELNEFATEDLKDGDELVLCAFPTQQDQSD